MLWLRKCTELNVRRGRIGISCSGVYIAHRIRGGATADLRFLLFLIFFQTPATSTHAARTPLEQYILLVIRFPSSPWLTDYPHLCSTWSMTTSATALPKPDGTPERGNSDVRRRLDASKSPAWLNSRWYRRYDGSARMT